MSRLLASILAREAAYRATRRVGKRHSFLGTGKMLKSNLLNLILFTFVSLSISFPFTMKGDIGFLSGILGIVGLFVGAFITAASVNVIVTDRLLEPLARLPIDESEVKKALLLLGLYLGGLSLPFAVVPGMALAAYRLDMPGLALWGVIEGVSVMLLAYGIGYLAGSLAPKAGRNPILRSLSTLAWFLLFGAWFIFRFVGKTGSLLWLSLVPPFSFAAAAQGDIASSSTSIAFAMLSVLTFLYGSGRLWRAARTAPTISVPKVPKAWRLWGSMAPVLKDLKLLVRNSRMLASTIYFMLIAPIFFVYPLIKGELIAGLLPAVALFAGGIGSYAVEYVYIVEGESARVLYLLPISRARLIRMKAAPIVVLGSFIALALGIFSTMVVGPLTGLSVTITYVLSLAGSALLYSFIVSSQLPKEPSSWTHQTFSRVVLFLAFLGSMGLFGLLAGICLIQSFIDPILLAPILALLVFSTAWFALPKS